MSAGTYNINIENGATFSLQITYKDGAGNSVDMTGYTARMQIRKSVGASVFEIELTTENGRIVYTNQAAGAFALSLSDTETEDLTGGVYDLELVSPTGTVTRLLQGKVSISKNVTR